mgnify:CR=1 FL=1
MKKKNNSPFVYSTNPEFLPPLDGEEQEIQTPAPQTQKLQVILETKHRAGKAVTLITGFVGTQKDREQLGKSLRNFCGTGGSVKDDEILIQGDQREKALQWLLKNGYSQTKKR